MVGGLWRLDWRPKFQVIGLGQQLMTYVLGVLRQSQVERLTLFADPEAVLFYSAEGWELEPQDRGCAYWHEPDASNNKEL